MKCFDEIAVGCESAAAGRESNQDRCAADILDARDNLWGYRAVLVVADGMGGHEQGELAAQIALEVVLDVMAARPGDHERFDAEFLGADTEGVVRHTFAQANQRIWRRAEELGLEGNMGTTLTLLVLDGEGAVVGHVGDSKAFVISGDGIEKVTEEHSWVGAMVREGAMTEEEAARSPLRGHLTQAMGSGETVEAYIRRLAPTPGDVLVVCSDGLTEVMAPDRIQDVVSTHETPAEACQALVSLATQEGARDNVTAALLVLPGQAGPASATQPAAALAPEAAGALTLFPDLTPATTPAEAEPAPPVPEPPAESPTPVLPLDPEPEPEPTPSMTSVQPAAASPAPDPEPAPASEPETPPEPTPPAAHEATPAASPLVVAEEPTPEAAAPTALPPDLARGRSDSRTGELAIVLGAVCLIALLAGLFTGKRFMASAPAPSSVSAGAVSQPSTQPTGVTQPAQPATPTGATTAAAASGAFHLDLKVEGHALVLTSSEKVTFQVYAKADNKDLLPLEGATAAGDHYPLPKPPSTAAQAATVTLDIERLAGNRLRLTPTPPDLRVFVDKQPYTGAALQDVPVTGRHARIGFYFPPGTGGGQYGVAITDFPTATEQPDAAATTAPPTESQPDG